MNYEKIEELREIKIHQRLKWVKPKSLQNANVVSQKSRGTTPLHFGDDDNTVSWSEINIIFSWRGELSLLYLSKPRKKKKSTSQARKSVDGDKVPNDSNVAVHVS